MQQNNLYDPTVTQQLIWMDQLLSVNSAKYNIGGYVSLTGNLDYNNFNNSIRNVLTKQEVFSSLFYTENDRLCCQVLNCSQNFKLEFMDFSHEPDAQQAALSWMEADFLIPIFAENEFLFRIKLLKVSGGKHIWYMKIHHIIGDGWSFMLFKNQVGNSYDAISKEIPDLLNEYYFSDYVLDEKSYLSSKKFDEDKKYWNDQFKVDHGKLFPKIFQSSNNPITSDSYTTFVNSQIKNDLETYARANRISVFQILLGLLIVYFGRTRNKTTLPVALPISNRLKKSHKHTAGVFMNLICVPFEFNPEGTLLENIHAVNRKIFSAIRHQKYQYGNLRKDLLLSNLEDSLFQIRVSFEDFQFDSGFESLDNKAFALSNKTENDPLAIYIRNYQDNTFDIRFIYNQEFLDKRMISSISSSLMCLISHLLEGSLIPCKHLPLLNKNEHDKISAYSQGSNKKWECNSFLEMWLDSVSKYPGNVAVSTDLGQLTYKSLHEKSVKIASFLKSAVPPGNNIAIYLPRNESMIIGMLSCMLAGCPFVAFDIDEPLNRQKAIMQNISCNYILTSDTLKRNLLPQKEFLLEDILLSDFESLSDASFNDIPESEVCYISYTSGSTGEPKGIATTHLSFLNYVNCFKAYFHLSPSDAIIQHASVGFDISMEEIFPMLLSGGKVYVLEDRKDLFKLANKIEEQRISFLSSTPGVIGYLNKTELPKSLRTIISGGEMIAYDQVSNLISKGIEVYNTYGPTEATICVTYFKLSGQMDIIPIGKPIPNTEVYVLDQFMNPQPIGVEGEIYIGGSCVAKGYINAVELTKINFISNPKISQTTLYKTGDLGRYDQDGNLIYTGRKDSQLKIRGVRIEPGEIEGHLRKHEEVVDLTVLAIDINKEAILFAFLVLKLEPSAEPNFRKFIRQSLPEYMTPRHYIPIKEVPLNRHGKIDKENLIAIAGIFLKDGLVKQYELPLTKYELSLLKIWEEILESVSIGITDNFFELGGHSIKANLFISKVYQRFSIRLTLSEVFTYPTIKQLANILEERENQLYDFVELD